VSFEKVKLITLRY